MTEHTTISSRLEIATRLGAVSLLGTYVAGFLIVSLHQASFGIAQFDLLKPRLLAAGTLFLVFSALSVLLSARAFGFFGLSTLDPTQAAEALPLPGLAIRFFDLAFSSVVLGMMTSVFFEGSAPVNKRYLWFVLGLLACVVLFLLGRRWLKQKMLLSTAMSLSGCVILFVVLTKFGDSNVRIRAYWFLGTGLWFAWQYSNMPRVKRLESPWLELLFVQLISLASAFALVVYPNVRFGLGGGAAAPMTLQFSGTSPFGAGDRTRVWYVDETDKGYYILLNERDKKAVFLPRDRITAIYFGDIAIASAPPANAEKKP